ncbi:MAG: GHKL domain-containing protein [Ignavibacteria bacterium]|nr:GHKL domain-containing protein [Ignavibacteria bacterium]
MIRIIDNLFFISKSENNLINLEIQPVEINSLLHSVVENMRTIAKDRNMDIVLNSSSPITLGLDAGLIKQALYNIVDNAIKYGDENSTIEIILLEESDMVIIDIINRGAGISEDKVEKIFDKFYRADESRTRKSGGVGLGLSVVKSIIEMHKGTVSVNSTPNERTTFTLSFPK